MIKDYLTEMKESSYMKMLNFHEAGTRGHLHVEDNKRSSFSPVLQEYKNVLQEMCS